MMGHMSALADQTNRNFADRQAERVLAAYWPDGRMPVDPVRIAKAMGVAVREGPLPPDISGALVYQDATTAVIVLEETDAPVRQRFTCAHELGHYVYRTTVIRFSAAATLPPNGVVNVDFRDQTKQNGTLPEEQFANRFAASLLMPAREIRRHISAGLSTIELAKVFDVSLDAISVRMRSLGIPQRMPV